jgi:hypothetical protein
MPKRSGVTGTEKVKMKMLKADFFALINSLQTAAATGFKIHSYPGMLCTELQYLTREGKLTYVRVCDSSTVEARQNQSTVYGRWLERAKAEWNEHISFIDPMNPVEAIELIHETVANVNQAMKCNTSIRAIDLHDLFTTLAKDIAATCVDPKVAQELATMITTGELAKLDSSVFTYVHIRKILDMFLIETTIRMSEMKQIFNDDIANLNSYINTLKHVICTFPHFNAESNSVINAAFEAAIKGTKDDTLRTWLGCNISRSFITDVTTQATLQPVIDQVTEYVELGYLPWLSDCVTEQELWEMDWWTPDSVVMTNHDGKGNYVGTAEVTDEEGR